MAFTTVSFLVIFSVKHLVKIVRGIAAFPAHIDFFCFPLLFLSGD